MNLPAASKRRPVPVAWREEHHSLETRSHAWGSGFRRASRTRGYCQCGQQWPESKHADNLTYSEVLDIWKDHVEAAYYATKGGQ